jgi:hypothetical protein
MTAERPSKPQQGFLNFAFMTILQGFLLGIGLLFVYVIYQGFQNSTGEESEDHAKQMEAFELEFGDKKPEADKDYQLNDVRKIEEGGSVRIVGKITNLHANRMLRGVVLQANLFNSNAFVDQYTEPVALRGGETRFFKIDCGCRGNPPAEHDRFEVLLVRSY